MWKLDHELSVTVYLALFLSLVSADCVDLGLGMANGAILDSEITASSELSKNTSAKNGRLNYTSGSSWCAGTSDTNPYLQIDLQTLHVICAVSTQGNSQADQWVKNYTIQFSNDRATWTGYKEGGKVKTFQGNNDRSSEVKHVLYESVGARHLRILPNAYHGARCIRMEAFGVKQKPVNVALRKATFQSSTFNNNQLGVSGASGKAVDGNSDTEFTNGSCTHTQEDNPSWWRVDLGSDKVAVSDIFIVNRFSASADVMARSESYKITLGDNPQVVNDPQCKGLYSFVNFTASAVCFINPLTTGRYVGISTVKNQFLQLCEVEIYLRDNLAFGKQTNQSSTGYGGASSRAVDGISNPDFGANSCTHTRFENNLWWRVDLGQVEPVSEIYLVNQENSPWFRRQGNFEIRVGTVSDNGGITNSRCGDKPRYSLPQGKGVSFYCRPVIYGRYVTIRSLITQRDAFTLCEVEVYSERRACQMQAVGVASNDTLPDVSFSASSEHSSFKSSKGRLNVDEGWLPSRNDQPNDYLQIDLQYEFLICAVATQGRSTDDDWTTEYKLQLSLDGSTFETYKKNNVDKIFSGNSGRHDIVKHKVRDMRARFIRFQPVKFKRNKALRVEVYGVLISRVPSQAPSNLILCASSSTSITASWQLPPTYSRHGIILGFKLFYKKKGFMGSTNVSTVSSGVTISGVITGLDKYTEYEFQVLAFTSAGNGPKSSTVLTTTMEDAPSAPTSLSFVDVPPSNLHGPRVTLSWSKPAETNGVIRRYNLFYSHDGGAPVKISGIDKDTLSQTVDVLGGLTYQFYVRAVTVKPGPNATITVTTKEYVPSRGPEEISSAAMNSTNINITWLGLPRELAYGNVIGYEVKFIVVENCTQIQSAGHSTINTTITYVLATGLSLCAKYEVSVRGYTAVGPGPYSRPVMVDTVAELWSKERPSSPSFSANSKGGGISAKEILPHFPGNARFFQAIIITYSSSYTGAVKPPERYTTQDTMTYEEAHKSSVPAAYITFQFEGNDFHKNQEFVVGDGAQSGGKERRRRSSGDQFYYNKPLQLRTNYRLFLRAFFSETVYVSSNFVTIDTKGKPVIKDLPETTITAIGELVVLTCEVSGDPEASVTWTKDGLTSIPRAQLEKNAKILIVKDVVPSDSGVYECTAVNMFGESRTTTIVIVAVPPRIIEDLSPSSVMCEKQTPCLLSCQASSYIPFNFSWTKDGQIPTGDNVKFLNNSLIVTPQDAQDYGDYLCHVTNTFGSAMYKITLVAPRDNQDLDDDTQSPLLASVISLSSIVFVLLIIVCGLIWQRRRTVPIKRIQSKEEIDFDGAKSSPDQLFSDEQSSDPNTYMELKPRPSNQESHVPSEYQSLQEKPENPGYYNMVLQKESGGKQNEEVYDEI